MKLVKGIILGLIVVTILCLTVLSVSATTINDNPNDNVSIAVDSNSSALSIEKDVDLDNISVEQNINLDNKNNSNVININQTSANTFILTLSDNSNLTVYKLSVNDIKSFKKATDFISINKIPYDILIINFKQTLNLKLDPWTNDLIHSSKFKKILIRGNGATISVNDPDDDDEFHFLSVETSNVISMNNITLSGFNTAVTNKGSCIFDNVVFNKNKINYWFDEDYGGAIRNYGVLRCENCTFTSNKASHGGAVYNDKGSQSTFIKCSFKKNDASKESDRSTNDGINIYTSKGASCMLINVNDNYNYFFINNSADLKQIINIVDSLGHLKNLVLDFAPGKLYEINSSQKPYLNMDKIDILYINGHGATISRVGGDISDESYFLKIMAGTSCIINDITITGYNTAIHNSGTLTVTNSIFRNNKCENYFVKDFGSAIDNDEGLLYLIGCTFEDNYAKYGGAIYNEKGIVSCNDCNFKSNRAYEDGGVIYNEVGYLNCNNCNFTYNNAANSAGGIYSHRGIVVLNNTLFKHNTGDDEGKAIYNDFGSLIVENCVFIVSKNENDYLFNYGDVDFILTGNSYVICDGKNKTISVTSDRPSETLRVLLRIGEVGACIAIVVISGAFCPEFTAGLIGFFGGAFFAAAEEVVEECYFEHNFNIWNVMFMAAVAGLLDGVSSGLGSCFGKTVVKEGVKEVTKESVEAIAKETVKQTGKTCMQKVVGGLSSLVLDFIAEVITEAIPRPDFSDFDVPILSN